MTKSDGVMEERVEMWEQTWFSGGVRLARIEKWGGAGRVWGSHAGMSRREGCLLTGCSQVSLQEAGRGGRLGLVLKPGIC